MDHSTSNSVMGRRMFLGALGLSALAYSGWDHSAKSELKAESDFKDFALKLRHDLKQACPAVPWDDFNNIATRAESSKFASETYFVERSITQPSIQLPKLTVFNWQRTFRNATSGVEDAIADVKELKIPKVDGLLEPRRYITTRCSLVVVDDPNLTLELLKNPKQGQSSERDYKEPEYLLKIISGGKEIVVNSNSIFLHAKNSDSLRLKLRIKDAGSKPDDESEFSICPQNNKLLIDLRELCPLAEKVQNSDAPGLKTLAKATASTFMDLITFGKNREAPQEIAVIADPLSIAKSDPEALITLLSSKYNLSVEENADGITIKSFVEKVMRPFSVFFNDKKVVHLNPGLDQTTAILSCLDMVDRACRESNLPRNLNIARLRAQYQKEAKDSYTRKSLEELSQIEFKE